MSAPAVPACVYPELVRARLAAGWSPEAAASTPPRPHHRLSREDVRAILASSDPARVLAAQHGVSPQHVRNIRRRVSRKAV